jgi:hypothetical protein
MYNMLKIFINLWPAMKVMIGFSKSNIFKNKNLILFDNKIIYLNKILKILEIFVKTTTKLQAEVYLTIYYMIPEIHSIYKRLDRIKAKLNISIKFFILG